VVNLLEHNSGLPTISPYKATKKIKNINDLKNFLNKRESLQFRPGRSASWNVLNFYLLAYIVNDKLKSSFRKYISKNIFDPLGMENSVVFKKSWFFKVPNKAIGYRRARENEFQKNELKNDNYIPGTNGIYSNLDDMVKWMNVWKTDTLLSKKTIGQINRINFVRGQKEFLGYGWKRSFNKGKKYFYSGGINQGNTHLLLRFPSSGIDIVILSNQSSLFNLRKNAFRLLNLFADKKYEVK
jgi:CubicO group peptidase (beta-lactamase class C family)